MSAPGAELKSLNCGCVNLTQRTVTEPEAGEIRPPPPPVHWSSPGTLPNAGGLGR